MKKMKIMLLSTMVIVAMAATFFVGCKKEKNEALTQPEKTEAQTLMNQIMAFQTLCESVNSGMKTEGVMSVEEMRQNFDLITNYEHSEHLTCCVNTVLDTLYLAMPPVDENGNITNMDAVTTYETFETEFQNHMEMVNDGRNIPSYFSIVMPEKTGKAEENITIVFLRGEERKEAKNSRNTLDDDGPFIQGLDNWYWGNNLGRCKWEIVNAHSDAAEQLTEEFVFVIPPEHQGENYLISNVFHVNYRPCEPNIPTITSQYYVDTDMEDCADTWLFCYRTTDSIDFCVMYSELNCYWRSIERNIVDPDAPLHFILHPDYNSLQVPYHTCSIHWNRFSRIENNGLYYYQVHYAHVIYCNILWNGPNPD